MLLCLSRPLAAQTSFDSLFAHPARRLPLPAAVNDLECDEEGNLFLLHSDRHRLYKLFARNHWDSLLTVGGKGSGEEGFNLPVKLSMPNRQNLFVLDQMNRRIAVLNTNLRVVEDINFLDIDLNLLDENLDYLNPLSFVAGPVGELYILNQEDLKVYKITGSGAVQTTFGGLDYGAGSLRTPDDVLISRDNYIFVSDSLRQVVTVFDLFGIYQYTLTMEDMPRWSRIVVYDQYMICLSAHHLTFLNLQSRGKYELEFGPDKTLIDIAGTRSHLFLLTTAGIEVYALK